MRIYSGPVLASQGPFDQAGSRDRDGRFGLLSVCTVAVRICRNYMYHIS